MKSLLHKLSCESILLLFLFTYSPFFGQEKGAHFNQNALTKTFGPVELKSEIHLTDAIWSKSPHFKKEINENGHYFTQSEEGGQFTNNGQFTILLPKPMQFFIEKTNVLSSYGQGINQIAPKSLEWESTPMNKSSTENFSDINELTPLNKWHTKSQRFQIDQMNTDLIYTFPTTNPTSSSGFFDIRAYNLKYRPRQNPIDLNGLQSLWCLFKGL
ncbi:MAG: hypothetical protein P1U56_24365 [Saprospiraceae bacterium]|nr:hypothetical protein [Saprospiraceae bacterium]